MEQNKELEYTHHEHKEIMLTIVYTIILAFFMWGLSSIIN